MSAARRAAFCSAVLGPLTLEKCFCRKTWYGEEAGGNPLACCKVLAALSTLHLFVSALISLSSLSGLKVSSHCSMGSDLQHVTYNSPKVELDTRNIGLSTYTLAGRYTKQNLFAVVGGMLGNHTDQGSDDWARSLGAEFAVKRYFPLLLVVRA